MSLCFLSMSTIGLLIASCTFNVEPIYNKEQDKNVADFYKPYAEAHANFLYNLLFCDDISLFKNDETVKTEGLWATLLADKSDLQAIRKIADDERNEGRVRALAFNRLRAAGQRVPDKKILGVIVEVPLENGLDTLAAFVDGGVRYLPVGEGSHL